MSVKLETIEIDDRVFTISIGRNAIGNNTIIKSSHPEDIWFHAENDSSCHVVLASKGYIVPKRYLREVANKVLDNTRFKNINYVIYTAIKNVKTTNVAGQVILKKFTKLKVSTH